MGLEVAISIEDVDKFLDQRGCVLYGRAFDIVNPKTRAEAAEWLHSQLVDLVDHVNRRREGG